MSVDLTEVSAKLNLASDCMTRYYAGVESRLRTASLGVEGYVKLTADTELGYADCRGRWQLVLRRNTTFVEPLCNSSRNMRMLCVPKISVLEEHLLELAEELADNIQCLLVDAR